jgi:uncharacterized protein
MSSRTFAIDVPMKEIAAFCQRWKVTEFALFGSILRDDFRPDSDVDVLLTFESKATWSLMDVVDVRDELQTIFKRKVDIVERPILEKHYNYMLRKAILGTAQVVYVR